MYLSVDIDFWNKLPLSDAYNALRLIKESGKLRSIVDNHKRLIPSVNKSGQSTVINIDTHSDIKSLNDIAFTRDVHPEHVINCGDWVNFIRKELRKEYIWMYPASHGVRCDCNGDVYKYPETSGWDSVTKKSVKLFPVELIDEATDIGIAVSYYYLSDKLYDNVRQLFKDVFCRAVRRVEKTAW